MRRPFRFRPVLFAAALFLLLAPIASSISLPAPEGRPISVEGRLALAVADYPDGSSRAFAQVETDAGRSVPLEFREGRIPEGWKSGDRIVVRGRAPSPGSALRVEDFERVAGKSSLDAASWTTGPKRLLVLLVNFLDDTSQPFTVSNAQSTFFGSGSSVANFYAEASYGMTTLSGTVAGYYTLPITKPTTCTVSPISTAANAAAVADGIDPSTYPFITYVFPRISACGWLGYSNIGATGNWLNGYMTLRIGGHELGHSYGLLHAHSLTCPGAPIGGSCSRSEYGDDFDIMGNEPLHFQAAAKTSLGWMSDAVTVSSGSAQVTIAPLEGTATPRAVKIPFSGGTYWLEYRQPIGFDASIGVYPGAIDGPLVHQQTSAGLDILDMKPSTSGDFTDAALSVGNTFNDSGSGVAVSVVSRSASGVTVQVSIGGAPPPPPPPPPVATRFYSLPPCRMADTREPVGPYGGPALASGATRTWTLTGTCGVPAGAAAVAANVAATRPSTAGNLSTSGGTSIVNFAAGRTRSNNAAIPLDASGHASLTAQMTGGTVDVIIDVSGYFQ